MRQIDSMTSEEIDVLKIKGMLVMNTKTEAVTGEGNVPRGIQLLNQACDELWQAIQIASMTNDDAFWNDEYPRFDASRIATPIVK